MDGNEAKKALAERLIRELEGKERRERAQIIIDAFVKTGYIAEEQRGEALLRETEEWLKEIDERDAVKKAMEDIEAGKCSVPELINFLGHKDKDVRWYAARSLRDSCDERAIMPLIDALTKIGEDTTFLMLIEAIVKFGEAAVEPLSRILKHENRHARFCAAAALGRIGDNRAIVVLIEGLGDEDAHANSGIVNALVKFGEAAVVPLTEALKSPNWTVSDNATEALEKIGSPSALAALTEALKDEKDGVLRSNAVGIIIQIELKNPGSVKLEDIERALEEFVKRSTDEHAKTEAERHYRQIRDAVGKTNMSGEVLSDKPKPPGGRTFRRRAIAK